MRHEHGQIIEARVSAERNRAFAWRASPRLSSSGHNLIVPSPEVALWPLALVLDLLCLAWMALVVGVVGARYRDVPLMIQSILSVFFWLTPVMYFPEQLGSKRYLADYNPFTHLLALLRDPFLGRAPTLNDWLIVLGITIVGWATAFLFFARFRARIAYWL